MRKLYTFEFWLVMFMVCLVSAFAAWTVPPTARVQAQQRPYVGYVIEGGCLYITAQGYAVIREWGGLSGNGVTCR